MAALVALALGLGLVGLQVVTTTETASALPTGACTATLRINGVLTPTPDSCTGDGTESDGTPDLTISHSLLGAACTSPGEPAPCEQSMTIYPWVKLDNGNTYANVMLGGVRCDSFDNNSGIFNLGPDDFFTHIEETSVIGLPSSFSCKVNVGSTQDSIVAYGAQVVETGTFGPGGTAASAVTILAFGNPDAGAPPPPAAPTAQFTTTQDVHNPLTWSFDGTPSLAGSGASIRSWDWSFGDNSTGTGETVSHTYASGGTHTVKLTVTDSVGQTGSISKTVRSNLLVVNSARDLPEVSPATAECDTGSLAADGSPECTLRAAIQVADADAAGPDTIDFDIPAGAAITPATALPAISAPMIIDGRTQSSGWVTIDGSNTGKVSLLSLTAGKSTITGLAVVDAADTALTINDAGHDVISGNRFGVTASGAAAADRFCLFIATSPNTTVGGSTSAAANELVANSTAITAINPGTDLSIAGNLIGTDPTGHSILQPAKAAFGILVGAAASTPGLQIQNNTVVDFAHAVSVLGAGITTPDIQNNRIGVASDGTVIAGPDASMANGIFVSASPDPQISGNVVDGASLDIAVSALAEYSSYADAEDGSTFTIEFEGPDGTLNPTGTATGIGGSISDNSIGVAADGVTLGQPGDDSEGIALYAGASGVTISGNAVEGLRSTGIEVNGGKSDTISGNHVGVAANGDAVAGATGSPTLGIWVRDTDATTIDANVVGLIFGDGIALGADTHAKVTNNLAGVVPGGREQPNKIGIAVEGVSTGTAIGPGNIASGNTDLGISVTAAGVPVIGNYIGTDPTGTRADGNYVGMEIANGGRGAAGAVTSNVISGNVMAGLQMAYGSGIQVLHNRIGLSAIGDSGVGNGTGIEVISGGLNNVHDNAIAYNSVAGVTEDAGAGATTLRSNSIYSNPVGINGDGASVLPSSALQRASRVTSGGVTRTWLVLPKLAGSTIEVFADTSCSDAEGKTPLKLQVVTKGEGSAQIVTIVGQTSVVAYTATITNAAGVTSAFTDCVAPTTDADSDNDGIPDVVESAGPGGADAAQNGQIADVPTDDGQFIQVRANGGTLTGVTPVADPGTEPVGVKFPAGLVSFTVTGLSVGADVPVTIALPQSVGRLQHYWRFGAPEPGQQASWYDWTYDKTTGAEPLVVTIDGTSYPGFVLHFVDGARGDDDGIANGTVVDPGGAAIGPGEGTPPAFAPPSSLRSLPVTGTSFPTPLAAMAVLSLLLGSTFVAIRRRKTSLPGGDHTR